MTTKADLKRRAENIRKSLQTYEKKIDKSLAEADDSLEAAREQLDELEILANVTTPLEVRDFFEKIGEGLVLAQTQLDEESGKYLARRPESSLPSVFRIPKVSAELKFALETRRSKKLSLFVYGSGSSRQQSQQHKVSFDIIAAPPPPDAVAELAEMSISLKEVFVLRLLERNRIQSILRNLSRNGALSATKREKAKLFASAGKFNRVLILRHDKENRWTLLLPLRELPSVKLDLIHVQYNGEDMVVKAATAPATFPASFEPLFGLLWDISENQEHELKELRSRITGKISETDQ